MSDLSSCIDFVRRLIQTRSLPGQEKEIAELVQLEMENLRFDRVFRDEAGNVIGVVRGQGYAPAVMFNTHLDHVDVGDPAAWPHPPYEGRIDQDRVWGRGAMDIKGPLAAQVYGIGKLIADGTRPPGDVYVTAVVQEEVGGLGARHLVTHLKPTLVVVGEASDNEIRRGHRGRTEAVLHARGKSVHASVPQTGVNPLHVIARFIQALERLQMRSHPELGASSVAVTLIRTDQTSPNVIPAEIWLTCDWRNVPGETSGDICKCLQQVAARCLIEGSSAEVSIPVFDKVSYTGLEMQIPSDNPAYILASDHPAVRSARDILRTSIGSQAAHELWSFATDGGHFAEAGLVVIGFGPGEERLAHTVEESISLSELERGLAGNQALALEWAAGVSAAFPALRYDPA